MCEGLSFWEHETVVKALVSEDLACASHVDDWTGKFTSTLLRAADAHCGSS
jgi:hypothetical protein